MQPLMLTDLCLHIPNFVPEEICDRVIDYYESVPKSKKVFESSYNQILDENVKSSGLCLKINEDSPVFDDIHQWTGKTIYEWIKHINNFGCFEPIGIHGLCQISQEYRIIKYYDGLRIHPHTDYSIGNCHIREILVRGSCTLNFSSTDDYDGGEFVLWRGRNHIKMGKGDAFIFPADPFWVHETMPVTRGARYAVNTFLHHDIETPDYSQVKKLKNIEKSVDMGL